MLLADLDLNKIYTYADYFKWQFDERVELIKGKIFEMSAPNRLHQKMSFKLAKKIDDFLEGYPCSMYEAPFDVRFPRKSKDDKDVITVLQPDICVICDPAKLDDRGCIGAPDIIVEILSPGNKAKELRNKYEIYEESGVKEYWIVSPQDETFLIYTLHNERYVPSRIMTYGDTVISSVLPGFSLDLTALFETVKK